MLKPIKQRRPKDISQLSQHLVNSSTSKREDSIKLPTAAQISLLMAELGRKGGKIGGKRRMQTMTGEERKRVAKKAARARWRDR